VFYYPYYARAACAYGWGEAVDTLTFLITILDAVVGCAKFAGLLVVVVIFAVNTKYLPMRMRKLVTRAAAAFLFALITFDCLQNLSCVAIGYFRLLAVISSLTTSVMLFLVLATVVLCCADASRKSQIATVIASSVTVNGSLRCLSKLDSRKMSSSFLATTPVLLA